MKAPSEDVVRSMSMLENNGHMRRILEWIEESRQQERDRCESETRYEQLHQAQGSALTLKDILKHFREAPMRHKDKEGRSR